MRPPLALSASPGPRVARAAAASRRGIMASVIRPPSPPPAAPYQAPPVPAKSLAAPDPDPAAAPAAGATTTRLAVIGDVHGAWGPEDDAALAFLSPAAALFVGDFGEEDTALVDRLAAGGGGTGTTPAPTPPRFFVLGNHDAWFCLTGRGRDRAVRKGKAASSPAPGLLSPGVRAQLAALGPAHVGWGHALLRGPSASPAATAGAAAAAAAAPPLLTIVGGRPFSKGGAQWSDVADFYAAFAGVANPGEAAEKTVCVLRQAGGAAPGAPLVLLAHNGPAGLGARAHDPCGADFLAAGGDWGDPDLAAALDAVAGGGGGGGGGGGEGTPPPPAAVLFGHMHRNLKGGGTRDAVRFEEAGGVRGDTGTVFLNAAVTPRRRAVPGAGAGGAVACHFLLVELAGGRVSGASDVWVGVTGDGGGGYACAPLLERALLVAEPGAGGARWAWQAHAGVWRREGEAEAAAVESSTWREK